MSRVRFRLVLPVIAIGLALFLVGNVRQERALEMTIEPGWDSAMVVPLCSASELALIALCVPGLLAGIPFFVLSGVLSQNNQLGIFAASGYLVAAATTWYLVGNFFDSEGVAEDFQRPSLPVPARIYQNVILTLSPLVLLVYLFGFLFDRHDTLRDTNIFFFGLPFVWAGLCTWRLVVRHRASGAGSVSGRR